VGMPPVVHIGSLRGHSRILTACAEMVREGGIGDSFDKLPVVAPAPEWMAEVYGDVWSDPRSGPPREGVGGRFSESSPSRHPSRPENRSAEQAVETVKAVLAAVDLPLIIWGCDVPVKDQVVMPRVAEATEVRTACSAPVTETEYRTLAAAAQGLRS